MLHKIRTLLKRRASSYRNVILWAMCCLAFFGFLRVSEFTIPTDGSYDLSSHLSLKDVAIDNRKEPRLLQLALKQLKTDTFKQGCKVYVGQASNHLYFGNYDHKYNKNKFLSCTIHTHMRMCINFK